MSLFAVVLALAGSVTFAATTASPKPSTASPLFAGPTDVCLSSDQAADIDTKIVVLERDLKLAKAKARKFGGVLGCGAGIGWKVDQGVTTVDATPFCGAVFGWRF